MLDRIRAWLLFRLYPQHTARFRIRRDGARFEVERSDGAGQACLYDYATRNEALKFITDQAERIVAANHPYPTRVLLEADKSAFLPDSAVVLLDCIDLVVTDQQASE